MVEVKTVEKTMYVGADGCEFNTKSDAVRSIVHDRLTIMFDDSELALMVIANKDKVIEYLKELEVSA